MTEPITRIAGTAVPLLQANVDTDQIMPKQFLKRVERSGFGPCIFHDWRASGDSPIDDPAYAGASILVTGENFGCGSSREQAVWGLLDHGFAAVVAPSFAPIFRENAARSRLLTVAVDAARVASIAARVTAAPATRIVIDIEHQHLRIGDDVVRFDLDRRTRDGFLLGLDEIGRTLEMADAIDAHERTRQPWLPTTRAAGEHAGEPDGTAEVITVGETMGCLVLDDHSPAGNLTYIGAESNVAIGLASLGHRVHWVSRLGSDRIGDHIVVRLRDRGVDPRVTRDPTRQTGLAIKELGPDRTVVRYYRQDSAASAMSIRDIPPLAGAQWLHVTGITPALSGSCARLLPELMQQAASQGVRVSLDVNLRPPLWPSLPAAADTIRRLCTRADLVFIGEDESRALRLGDTLEQFAEQVTFRPEAIIVFKRGPHGAQARAAGTSYRAAAEPAWVVDLTGAGDAFAAGFLSGLLHQQPIGRCLRLGNEMAAQVIGTGEDFAGPPTTAMRRRLARSSLPR